MSLVFEPFDVWDEFEETAPSAIKREISTNVYKMAERGEGDERIKTFISNMQAPLPYEHHMDDGMMDELILSKRRAVGGRSSHTRGQPRQPGQPNLLWTRRSSLHHKRPC